LFNDTFPFTVSLPLTHPGLRCLPLPLLFPVPLHLFIWCSLLFPGPSLIALCALLTLTTVIVITIARTALSISQCTRIPPVPIIIILVNYLIPTPWSNGQEVIWFVLLAAWWFNLCPEVITTLPTDTLSSAFNLPQDGCLQIGMIYLIPNRTGVLPPPIDYLVSSLLNIHPIYERKASQHSWNGKHLLLLCGHISYNCKKWRVMMGSRNAIAYKRSHVLSFFMPRTLCILLSPCLRSRMNSCIQSRFNDMCWLITDVTIFALVVSFPVHLRLPFGGNAVSWEVIYNQGISIMIQLHVVEWSPERTYKTG